MVVNGGSTVVSKLKSSRAPPPSTVAWKEVENQAYPQFCSVVGIPTIPPAPIRLQYLITPTQLYHMWILHTLDWLRGVANTHFNKWYSSLFTDQNKTVDRLDSRPPFKEGGNQAYPQLKSTPTKQWTTQRTSLIQWPGLTPSVYRGTLVLH